MTKISKEDLQIKKDWIVISFDHERYTFDCDIYYVNNQSLQEIVKYHDFDINQLEEFGSDKTRYLIDNCNHTECDLWYLKNTICKRDMKHLQGYSIDALIICDANVLQTEAWNDNECHFSCMPFCFGCTEKKFGLLDYKINNKERENND